MDVLMAHQTGHANVVGASGTALTDKQAAILKKLARRIVLALDADTAGDLAALKGAEVLEGSMERIAVPDPGAARPAGHGAPPGRRDPHHDPAARPGPRRVVAARPGRLGPPAGGRPARWPTTISTWSRAAWTCARRAARAKRCTSSRR